MQKSPGLVVSVPATLLLLSIPPALQAQEPAHLDEVVVISSRVGTPFRQIGTSVSVIDQDDIAARGNLSLTDVLRQMPAIGTSGYGGAGKTTVLRIRGEEGFRTLMIFDGLRLSDPAAPQITPQFDQVLSSGIGRVEVLRGPQGLSYGADAGGVVTIDSLAAPGNFNAGLDVQGGAFGTRQLHLDAGGAGARTDYFLSATDYQTDGFNARTSDLTGDDDGYDNTTLHGRVGFRLSDALRLDLVHRDLQGETELDGCGFPTVHDCRSDYDVTASGASLSYVDEAFTHKLSVSDIESRRQDYTGGSRAFASDGNLTRLEYLGSTSALSALELVYGADLERADSGNSRRENIGLHVEYLSDFSDRFFLSAGVRHDDNEDFGTNTSYRISGALLLPLDTGGMVKLRSSYGSGFRAPSPYEIEYNKGPYAYPPASALTLRQETSEGWEAAVEYVYGNSVHLEAVYFDQQVEDAIYFDLSAYSGYLQDTGTGKSTGVELSAEVQALPNLNIITNVTFNDTERPDGQQRIRRPELLANFGLSYSAMAGRFSANGFLRSSRDSIDEVFGIPGSVKLDDFDVLDLNLSFSVNDSLRIYGRLENALDESYQEVYDYNTADRAFYIGVKFSFQ